MSDPPSKKTEPLTAPGVPSATAARLADTPPDAPTLLQGAGEAATAEDVPAALRDHPRYRVQRLLGQGGMGAVYLAEHLLMGRRVALKVISAKLSGNDAMLARFRQEVRAVAGLSHPNIVAAYDADAAGDLHFLVMEYIDGASLAEHVAKHGPLPVGEACAVVEMAALGLQHAFERGMIHRDVKPHNLMRTHDGQVKVLDFGLARLAREQDEAADATRTASGVVMGTADYIAPEQTRGSRLADTRSDIYSLGCTFYYLLAGRVPFTEGSVIDKMVRHTLETPPSLTLYRPDVPPGVRAVVERMMAKDPAQRYQTPAEVVRALAALSRPAPPEPTARARPTDHAVPTTRVPPVPHFDEEDLDELETVDDDERSVALSDAGSSPALPIVSLVLGLVALTLSSCCLSWLTVPLSALGLVLGIMGLFSRPSNNQTHFILAVAGTVVSGLALFVVLVGILVNLLAAAR